MIREYPFKITKNLKNSDMTFWSDKDKAFQNYKSACLNLKCLKSSK